MTLELPPPALFFSPAIHKTYEFYALYYKVSLLLPKKDRYVLGARTERLVLELLELLLLAQTKHGKSQLLILNKADINLKTLNLFIRLTFTVKAINQPTYITLATQLVEIGNLIGGWIKSSHVKGAF